MDRHLRERFEKALEDSASRGSDLAGFDDTELSGYSDLVNSLRADAAALAGPVSSDFGRAQMLSSLRSQDETNGGVRRMIFSQPLVIKVAGAVAGTALVFVGMAGASAATGGPDVADTVLGVAGIDDDDDTDVEDANDDVDDDADEDADEDADDDADEDADDDADDDDADGADDDADVEDDADDADDEADDQADVEDANEVDDSADDSTDDEADDASDDEADDSADDDAEDDSTDGS